MMEREEVTASAVLIATCEQCRNAMAYLAGDLKRGAVTARFAFKRFESLPVRHSTHGPGTTADTEVPR